MGVHSYQLGSTSHVDSLSEPRASMSAGESWSCHATKFSRMCATLLVRGARHPDLQAPRDQHLRRARVVLSRDGDHHRLIEQRRGSDRRGPRMPAAAAGALHQVGHPER